MKKIVFLSLFALALPAMEALAQSNDDDLYFIPSKEKEELVKSTPAKQEVTRNTYTSPNTTVVVRDRKGNTRDVDEYNRRYEARDNEFVMEDDTLFVQEKAQPDLDGEWVNGEFNGSDADYEYAERIIRFRNPRYAISVSSPLYWDVVYGADSWNWNVYSDGLYAYAFPTFSNRLWMDWRFNSYGSGWGFGFGSPYWGGGYWGNSWYGGGYWGGHHHHGYYPGWGGGGYYPNWGGGSWNSNRTYTDRRSSGRSDYADGIRRQRTSTARGTTSTRRVVGTRSSTSTRSSSRGNSTRVEGDRQRVSSSRGTSTRRGTYTRPSSTRSSSTEGTRRSTTRSSTESTRTYNRGSSTSPTRSSSATNTRRSSNSNPTTRSYSPSSSSSSRSSSSYSGGSSSRSSSSGSSRSSSGSRR